MEGRLARLFGTSLIAGSLSFGGCAILREQAISATPEPRTASATAAPEPDVYLEPRKSPEEEVARTFLKAAIAGDREAMLRFISPEAKEKDPFTPEFVDIAQNLFQNCDPHALKDFTLEAPEEPSRWRIAYFETDCLSLRGPMRIHVTLDVSRPDRPFVYPGPIGKGGSARQTS